MITKEAGGLGKVTCKCEMNRIVRGWTQNAEQKQTFLGKQNVFVSRGRFDSVAGIRSIAIVETKASLLLAWPEPFLTLDRKIRGRSHASVYAHMLLSKAYLEWSRQNS